MLKVKKTSCEKENNKLKGELSKTKTKNRNHVQQIEELKEMKEDYERERKNGQQLKGLL